MTDPGNEPAVEQGADVLELEDLDLVTGGAGVDFRTNRLRDL